MLIFSSPNRVQRLIIFRACEKIHEQPVAADAGISTMHDTMPESNATRFHPVLALSGIGMEMVGFTLLGVLIDWLANSLPIFTAVLTILGMVVAFWHLVSWSNRRGKS